MNPATAEPRQLSHLIAAALSPGTPGGESKDLCPSSVAIHRQHRTSGASSGELVYFQLTPPDTPRSLVGRRVHQEDSPRCSSRTAQLTQWLQQLRRCGSEKSLLDLIAAEDPTPPEPQRSSTRERGKKRNRRNSSHRRAEAAVAPHRCGR